MNKEEILDMLNGLLEKGNNSWGFRFRNKETDIKDLKKYIKEI
jgi:hypothetical protein